MEGLQILNQTAITKTPGWCIWVVAFSIVFIVVGFGIAKDACEVWEAAVFGGLMIAGIVGLIVSLLNVGSVPTEKYKYEAIISDEVSIVELYEHYEVVEQRGEIWVLKDKETGVDG